MKTQLGIYSDEPLVQKITCTQCTYYQKPEENEGEFFQRVQKIHEEDFKIKLNIEYSKN